MASTYNLEPPPTGKVLLQTSSGDISLEIFAKQCPNAARNFFQHCLDGYYVNTIFHRLVADFIIQGGDPTGTGAGGISAINDGDGFGDEIHSRLKFNRRGLLGMAKGEDGTYGSQFFITLGQTPELQGKATMFGRIEGNTIYNLQKMAEAEMAEGEGSERPLYPTRVTGAEVLVNPFEDMIARVREAPRTRDADGKRELKKRKKPAGKNVLSFGGDEGEEDTAPVLKKVKANPKLVSVGQEEPDKLNNTKMPEAPAQKQKKSRRRQELSPESDAEVMEVAAPLATQAPPIDDEESDDDEAEQQIKQSALDRTNAEIAALKASMKRTFDIAPREKERPKNALEAMIPTTSTRGRKRGKLADERGAIDLFKAFKQRLEDLPPSMQPSNDEVQPTATTHTNGDNSALPTTSDPISASTAIADDNADDDEALLCDLHFIANCQSCKSWGTDKPGGEAEAAGGSGGGGGDDDADWMTHTLSFAKDTLGKDLEWKKKMAEIEVIDPREKARVLKEERRKGKEKERGGGRR